MSKRARTPEITPPPLSSQAMADLLCTIVLLCRGTHGDNQPFWAYMGIKPSMAKAFDEARASGAFAMEDFGTVLEWGEGLNPPPDVTERMQQQYAVSNDYESELFEAITGAKA